MSFFRSEKMVLCQLFIPPEAAYDTIADLGELGIVQFRNLNDEAQTSYFGTFGREIRLCNEMERKLRFIEIEMKLDDIRVEKLKYGDYPEAPNQKEFYKMATTIDRTEEDIQRLSHSKIKLKLNYLELLERKCVLEKSSLFFADENQLPSSRFSTASLMTHEELVKKHLNSSLEFVCGMVDRERVRAFQTMLWRISNGNLYYHDAQVLEPFENPLTGDKVLKNVFILFYQGGQLKAKFEKVCYGFRAQIYDCPMSSIERKNMLQSVQTQLDDLKIILKETHDFRFSVLSITANNLYKMICQVRKAKAIFHALNYFTHDNSCVIGECWIPKLDLPKLNEALDLCNKAAGSNIPSIVQEIKTDIIPPTYVRTNKFTRGFQNLIDAYGTGTYREVNPGLYTIITFPFLFAVMFGDMGHGLIIFLFGAWMCIFEKRLMLKREWGEIWDIFFSGRYIILLMGLFSIYTGFVYNDIFSKSFTIWSSAWRVNYNASTIINSTDGIGLDPATKDLISGYTYPIGVDPVWQLASAIKFSNSYKMKISVIFGVIHMMGGVILSAINMCYYKKYVYLGLQFIPQMLILSLIFGYMVFMIFYKWVAYTAKTYELEISQACAPSILILFINMILFKSTQPKKGCDQYMFNGQHELQKAFAVIAIICIPWLLLGKPLYIIFTRKMAKRNIKLSVEAGIDLDANLVQPSDGNPFDSEEEHQPMSEIFIHSGIQTIEYVLSTISHTASYLRLWALSLAHAQLSAVLWNLVFRQGFDHIRNYLGIITIAILFVCFAFLTIAIMVMMEALSAFLHCLRLHWVEFMSKFFSALGYPFLPFDFATIMDEQK